MRLIVHVNTEGLLEKIQDKDVDIAVGIEYYSSRSFLNLSYDRLKQLKMNTYVFLNRLYDQKEIEGLKEVLTKLMDCGIKGIIFQDFGILNMAMEMNVNYDLIYSSDTLTTSHASINTLAMFNVKGAMLASQLHYDEIVSICNESVVDIIVPIHGKMYISHSKRNLLSNYFEYIHKDVDHDYYSNIIMKVNQSDDYSHIYEDKDGTHVLETKELCLKDVMNDFKCQYGYIETLYLNDDYVLELIDFYNSDLSYKDLEHKYPTHTYTTGFVNDGTVYKLEDVRKREANEKCK